MANFVTDPPDDSLPPSGEEQSQPEETRLREIEHSEGPEETRPSEMQQVMIMSMCNVSPFSSARIDIVAGFRATDLTLGLKRIPAGFYVIVLVDGAEWQTTNKSVHIDQDIVEWNERIIL